MWKRRNSRGGEIRTTTWREIGNREERVAEIPLAEMCKWTTPSNGTELLKHLGDQGPGSRQRRAAGRRRYQERGLERSAKVRSVLFFDIFFWYNSHIIEFTFKLHNSVIFKSIFTESCNHQPYLTLEHYHLPKKRNAYPSAVTPHFFFPQPLVTTTPFSSLIFHIHVFYNLWPYRSLYKSGFFHSA